MSVSFNIYNILSSTYWKPVDFSIIGDQFKVKRTPILTQNGMNFYFHNFLEKPVDFTFNNKTGTFLTNFLYNSVFLENNTLPEISKSLTKIETPVTTLSGYVVSIVSTNSALRNQPIILSDSKRTDFLPEDVISFEFETDSTVLVRNKQDLVLTYDSNLEILRFLTKQYPTPSNQKFDFILGDSSIVLFEQGSNFEKIVTRNPSLNYNNFILSSVSLSINDSFPEIAKLNFISYTKKENNEENSLTNSFIVKYETNPITSQKQLTINKEYSNENVLSQNFLGLFPVENPKIEENFANYLLQIHGLKNHQTPEYKYSTANPLISSSPSIRRVYNKIYTGTNQNRGYNNVLLGFKSKTKEYTFPVDVETPFYFPPTSESIPLSSSGLIEDGAFAGDVPFVSDRLSVYRKNYEEVTPGVAQPTSITKHDNVWLCSWLSGSRLGDKIWLDRYYNAAYYTLDQALTAKAFVYNESLSPERPLTYDTPSTIVFEPGILYKYERAGKNRSKEFISYLNNDVNLPKGINVLSITNWVSSPLIDESNYNNNGLVFYSDPNNFKGSYWILDGKSHAVFPSRISLLQKSNFTVSIWLDVKDWKNIYGDQIFGNYYESGFGLVNLGFLSAPIFTITNAASSTLYNLNYRSTKLSQLSLSANKNSNFEFVQRLPDYSYWVFDSINKIGFKYNAINNLVGSLSLAQSPLSSFTQVEIDGEQNFYFYDNFKKIYVKTDKNGTVLDTHQYELNSGILRIELDKNNQVVPVYGHTSIIDNNNNIWEVVGGNLYKNRIMYANVGTTQYITCDGSNNIWVAHQQDTISRLNLTTNTFDFSMRIGRRAGAEIDPCYLRTSIRYLNFLKIPVNSAGSCNPNIDYVDVIVILDKNYNEIYLMNQGGELLSRLDLRGLLTDPKLKMNFYAKGDFTGYQYLRKYEKDSKTLAWKVKIADPNGNDGRLLSLNYNVSTMPPGWHNFVFVFNTFEGKIQYYIDSIKVDQIDFEPVKYQLQYDFRSSLLLGAATIRNTTLNDIIGVEDNYKFIGNVSDLKMYSKAFSQGEIEQLYFSSDFAIARKDLHWNMNVGERNFIEEVQHWYKMQLPGSKSKYFNINIHNLNIDDTVKEAIESALRSNIKKLIPAESSLYKINWM